MKNRITLANQVLAIGFFVLCALLLHSKKSQAAPSERQASAVKVITVNCQAELSCADHEQRWLNTQMTKNVSFKIGVGPKKSCQATYTVFFDDSATDSQLAHAVGEAWYLVQKPFRSRLEKVLNTSVAPEQIRCFAGVTGQKGQ